MNATPPPEGSNAILVQPCPRCGARWQVRDTPAYWCPRCDGVLGAPVAVVVPAAARGAARRSYRWVARPPAGPSAGFADHPTTPAALGPTPRYRTVPQWGLPDGGLPDGGLPGDPAAPELRPARSSTELAVLTVCLAALVYSLAAAAEIGRYLILLRSRTQLIDPWLLWLSDGAVSVFAVLALPTALVAAYFCVGWLAQARRIAFERVGRSDPRSPRLMTIWCLVPVINLVLPAVLLTELADQLAPRLRSVVRIWWCTWVFGAIMSVISLAWHAADTLQAQANGVAVAAFTDLVAVVVAVVTLWVIREADERDLLGRRRAPKRRVVAFGPARPVIEPIEPHPVVGAEVVTT